MSEVRLIDADALHAKICEDSENNYGASVNIAQVLLYIETAPTIEAEPVRHAHWVNDTFCSKCNRFPVDCSLPISNRELTRYFERCPHCGAIMGATDTNVGGKGGDDR